MSDAGVEVKIGKILGYGCEGKTRVNGGGQECPPHTIFALTEPEIPPKMAAPVFPLSIMGPVR